MIIRLFYIIVTAVTWGSYARPEIRYWPVNQGSPAPVAWRLTERSKSAKFVGL
jgi:hypothetical protein